MHKLIFITLLTVCLGPACSYAQPQLHTSKQFHVDARLTQFDERGHCVFQHGEQSLELPANQVVRWSSGQQTTPGSAVALADGSWLVGQLQWLTDRRVRVLSKWFEAVELDIDTVRALMVNPSPSWSQTQLLQSQMLNATGSQDLLWKLNAESASGIVTIQIKKSVDAAGPDRASWNFKAPTATTSVEVPQSELAGVTFSPILRRSMTPGKLSAHLRLVDGASLLVNEFRRREDGRVELALASGQKLISLDEADQFVLSIAQLTAQPSGVTWLGDLEPARYRLLDSDSQVPWPLGRNRDLFGKRIFDATGQAVEHALVIHSPAQTAYRWDGKTARLVAMIEILGGQEMAGPEPLVGSAQCQVLVGRDGQLVKAWQSEVLRAGQSAVLVDADISRAQLIVLLVDQADMGTIGDHVMWRDVRVVTE